MLSVRSILEIRKSLPCSILPRPSSISLARGRNLSIGLSQDDPRQRRPDISRAEEVLKWKPRTPLKEGLVKTIGYFEELLKSEKVRETLTVS